MPLRSDSGSDYIPSDLTRKRFSQPGGQSIDEMLKQFLNLECFQHGHGLFRVGRPSSLATDGRIGEVSKLYAVLR